VDRNNTYLQNGDHSNWKSAKDTLPPLWVDNIEQAEADISKIQSKSMYLSFLQTIALQFLNSERLGRTSYQETHG
jgi:hypothetical protein